MKKKPGVKAHQPTPQPKTADLIRQQTLAAQHAHIEVQREEAQQRRELEERTNTEVQKNIHSIFTDKWLPQLQKAADDRRYETLLHIGSHRGRMGYIGAYARALIRYGIPLLKEEGFTAEEKSDYSPRLGSDDDYGDTTTVSIKVTW